MSQRKPVSDKVAALRQQGVLHRSPEKVADELFLTHPFFDARDLVQVKYEMLRRVEKDDWPVVKAASTFGLSRPAYYAAQEAVKTDGLLGLFPGKRGPKGAHKLTDEVLAFVDQLREQNPRLTTAAAIRAIKKKLRITVHRRSLERALSRRGKERP